MYFQLYKILLERLLKTSSNFVTIDSCFCFINKIFSIAKILLERLLKTSSNFATNDSWTTLHNFYSIMRDRLMNVIPIQLFVNRS